MANTVILEVTNDKYELIVGFFDTIRQMAKVCGLSYQGAYRRIYLGLGKKTKFIRVKLED